MSKLKNIKLFSFIIILVFIALFLVFIISAGSKYELFYSINWIYIAILPLLVFVLFGIIIQVIIIGERTENKFADFKNQIEKQQLEKQEKKEEEEVQVEIIDFSKEKERLLNNVKKSEDIESFAEVFLSSISKEFELVSGLFYLSDKKGLTFNCISSYAYFNDEEPKGFTVGEGLNGQAVKNKAPLYLDEVPENHISVLSGTGKGNPKFLSIIPLESKNKVFALVEMASFVPQSENLRRMIMEMGEDLAKIINEISKKKN